MQLYEANHLYLMKMALIKTKPRTKPSPSIQQQPTANSLHNHLPREVRNIIPEPPTQNVPALPQNSSPLVRQHQSHSCNKNPPVTNTSTNTKLKLIKKALYKKILTDIIRWQQKRTTHSRIHIRLTLSHAQAKYPHKKLRLH